MELSHLHITVLADPHTRGQSPVELALSGSGGTQGELIVGGEYRLLMKIGSGSFGDIYLGVNATNGEVRDSCVCQVAIITLIEALSLIRRWL